MYRFSIPMGSSFILTPDMLDFDPRDSNRYYLCGLGFANDIGDMLGCNEAGSIVHRICAHADEDHYLLCLIDSNDIVVGEPITQCSWFIMANYDSGIRYPIFNLFKYYHPAIDDPMCMNTYKPLNLMSLIARQHMPSYEDLRAALKQFATRIACRDLTFVYPSAKFVSTSHINRERYTDEDEIVAHIYRITDNPETAMYSDFIFVPGDYYTEMDEYEGFCREEEDLLSIVINLVMDACHCSEQVAADMLAHNEIYTICDDAEYTPIGVIQFAQDDTCLDKIKRIYLVDEWNNPEIKTMVIGSLHGSQILAIAGSESSKMLRDLGSSEVANIHRVQLYEKQWGWK